MRSGRDQRGGRELTPPALVGLEAISALAEGVGDTVGAHSERLEGATALNTCMCVYISQARGPDHHNALPRLHLALPPPCIRLVLPSRCRALPWLTLACLALPTAANSEGRRARARRRGPVGTPRCAKGLRALQVGCAPAGSRARGGVAGAPGGAEGEAGASEAARGGTSRPHATVERGGRRGARRGLGGRAGRARLDCGKSREIGLRYTDCDGPHAKSRPACSPSSPTSVPLPVCPPPRESLLSRFPSMEAGV